ncbi:MAG: D-alanyl-D-alanine carboxypeptidase [Clostridiales bacterium]|nr:D-alanyl-D-alanine carboxypeptidase [Clostridiales bacterium]
MKRIKKSFYVFLLTVIAAAAIGCAVFKDAPNARIYAAEKKVEADMALASKSAYLADFNTGTELYSKNPDQKLKIASMVKIMTLLLSFEAVDSGVISLDTEVQVSENASGMGGSQVYLDANTVHPVRQLLKAMTVCSANDASVAMAETVAGSEEIFVARMNERAKELGMENTLFSNCTGLPTDTEQYCTARDASKMFRELLKHKGYFEFTKIWLEDYTHPDGRTTEMTNTNKLVRFYKGCDAGKTGFTQQSMYCISASAMNNNMRTVAVVMGAETSQKRFEDVKKLFNYGFANFENKRLAVKGGAVENTIKVKGGKTDTLKTALGEDYYVLGKRGDGAKYTVEYELPEEVKAKITEGQTVGTAVVKKDGAEIARVNIVAAEAVEKSGFFDGIKKIIGKW